MAWADSQGLEAIEQRLKALQPLFGDHWQPAKLIEQLATEHKRFADMRVSDVQEGQL
jgi:hypothetical protein